MEGGRAVLDQHGPSRRIGGHFSPWFLTASMVEAAEDLAQEGVFDTDGGLDAFLTHATASHHADLA